LALFLDYLCDVRNSVRILSVLLLTAIYCYAIGTVDASFTSADAKGTLHTEQEKYTLNVASHLFCHTSQTENSVSSPSQLPTPSLEKQYDPQWAAIKAAELLFETEFYQYSRVSRNFLILCRKVDLLFPFHYFW